MAIQEPSKVRTSTSAWLIGILRWHVTKHSNLIERSVC